MARSHFKGPVVSANGFSGPIIGTLSGNISTTTVAASGAMTAGTIAVGTGGSVISKIKKGTIAVNLDSINNAEVGEITLTITGAVVGDSIVLNPLAAGNTAGLVYGGARVSAADEVKMRIFNGSAAPINEASQLWDYILIRV